MLRLMTEVDYTRNILTLYTYIIVLLDQRALFTAMFCWSHSVFCVCIFKSFLFNASLNAFLWGKTSLENMLIYANTETDN